MARFRNPISISRDELMRSSKIGSVNTYIRCMKELDKWKYIQYIPSFNPQKGSQVYLYNFNTAKQHQNQNTITTIDNSNNNGSDISTDKGNNKTGKKATGKAGETQVIPSINNTNKLNSTNNLKGNKPTQNKVIIKKSISDDDSKKQKEKLRQKKNKKSINSGVATKPTSKSIAAYFTEKQWPTVEGEKFFNHYESNGWLVGGKSPMKNWRAAARNWMLNSEKFNNGKAEKGRAGKLHATAGKDYYEPL
ncbi:MAG: transcriptional regulator [Bacteroidia bacterium]|nr:transcriptional regulator [Bacteroidia bacterium]